jgi:predicted urease superfamily metal-dependent hydrolase
MRLEQVSIGETGFPEYEVLASSFMVFHTILRYSQDYSESLRWARKLTDEELSLTVAN